MRKLRNNGLFPILVLLGCIVLVILNNLSMKSTQAASEITTFAVGAGFVDDIPRQIVRAKNDRLYIFAGRKEGTTGIAAYWTTTAGLPASGADFQGTTTLQDSANPISVDAVYDGDTTIHLLVNNNSGILKDYPFSTLTDTFKSPITIATGNPTVVGDYIGTMGVSGMVDLSGNLHIAYWASGKHIVHKQYTYSVAANTLTQVGTNMQVDSSGSANHPSLAVSPLDNSITVAWVSEASSPVTILARSRTSSGTWGAVQVVSTAPAWTSVFAGINIDQGPSMMITSAGVKNIMYIENWDTTGFYGRVHHVTNSGSGWVDATLPTYSHAPAPAMNSAGEFYMIGHGPESNHTNINMYVMKKTGATTWDPLQLVAAPPSGSSFDSGPSVKWSAVGNNRPETIEFIYFLANGSTYYDTTIYYGRIAATNSNATNTPTATKTATATSTPTATNTPTPTPTNTPVGGFPTTGILDNFNRTNGALGSSWTGSTSGYTLSSSRVDVLTGGDIYWSPTLFGPNQEVFETLSSIDTSGSEIDLLLKGQTGDTWQNGVIEVLYNPSGHMVQVLTYSVAQGWVQRGNNLAVTFVNGDVFGARATAAGQVEVYRSGVLVGKVDITAWPYYASGGAIGSWIDSAANTLLDDFGGGNMVSMPTVTLTSTRTPTATRTFTPTPTQTFTPTFTPSPTPRLIPLINYYTTNKPTLTWNRVTWAVRYELQIANNAAFTNATTYDVGNKLAFTFTSPLSSGEYFWRVRACSTSTAGSCGGWSNADTFAVAVP